MQLKRKRRLKRALLASSCALLGTTAQKAAAAPGDWSFDTGVLYYSEQDRVQAIEPAMLLKRDFGDDAFLNLRLVTDTLSGATPTGAMPSSKGGTVTSASGGSSTNTPGANPVDNNFRDLRRAISASWSQPFADVWHLDTGASYSIEYDFKSQGVNALLSRDFDERNTTLSVGVADEWDVIDPIGGVHAPLTPQDSTSSPNPAIAASRSKKVQDLLAGATQVLSRNWIAQFNFSYSRSDGYENDPYKVVSIINTHLGGFLPAFPGGPGGPGGGFGPPIGEPTGQIYENRPDLHQKRALYLDNKVYLAGDVVDFSYRYGWDDWGIHSNTYELHYRFAFSEGYYLQPHVRYYHQGAAYFYQRGLLDSDTVPQFVSADYRLAQFTARTVGLEFGMPTSWGGRASLRIERYVQSGGGDNSHVQIGVQQPYDLFPELKADIAQLSLSF
jgi:hypothetical protein